MHKVDITPLLSPGVGVAHMRLSEANAAPLVVLTNNRAALFHRGLGEWLRVVDGGGQLALHTSTYAPAPGDDGAYGDKGPLPAAAAAQAVFALGAVAVAGDLPAPFSRESWTLWLCTRHNYHQAAWIS